MKKTYDNNSVSISSGSVKNETRSKFDELLKKALASKSDRRQGTVKNKFISDTELSESQLSSFDNSKIDNDVIDTNCNDSLKVVKVDIHQQFEKEDNYILHKFLNDSNAEISNHLSDSNSGSYSNTSVNKHERSKSSSSISNHTYEIESAEVNKKSVDFNGASNFSKKVASLSSKLSDSVSISLENTISTDNVPKLKIRDSDHEEISKISSARSNLNYQTVEENNGEVLSQLESKSCSIIYENERKHKRRKCRTKVKRPKTLKKISNTSNSNYDYKHIIGITVHKTDRLKLDSLVIHPVVKIHIVNSETGEYLRKSDANRAVVFYYENKDVLHITPVISECYNLYEKHSFYPAWEETMIINEDFNYLLEAENNPIIFFEVMDFLSFAEASDQFYQKGSTIGWNKIAWAFLKPLGANGHLNVDKKVRLQLFYPDKHKKSVYSLCDIFHWWNNKKFSKYPSSIYVTVKRLIPPEKIIETFRSKTPIHKEVSSKNTLLNYEINQAAPGTSVSLNDKCISSLNSDEQEKKLWSKISYQSCKLPNKYIAEIPSFEEGCLIMKFSNNGLFLAYSVLIKNIYNLMVYSVKSLEVVCKLPGHQGLIYDIAWSPDDQIIVTVSADCTASIWNFTKQCFIEILPHPAYVYATEISNTYIIATGCFDHIVRIWCYRTQDLIQELDGHAGYITSLCFNKKSTLLISADSLGVIIVWKFLEEENWIQKREYNLVHLRNTVIDKVILHKGERRLLINGRDDICIMDLKTGCVLNWFQAKAGKSFKSACDFSCCGTFLFISDNNGIVNVWNSDLGQLIATYNPYHAFGYQSLSINCIKFHPLDNIFAASHYGHALPILLTSFDPTIANNTLDNCSIGLKIINRTEKLRSVENTCSQQDIKNVDICPENEIETKSAKIKFQDVIQKIDQIIINKHSLNKLDLNPT